MYLMIFDMSHSTTKIGEMYPGVTLRADVKLPERTRIFKASHCLKVHNALKITIVNFGISRCNHDKGSAKCWFLFSQKNSKTYRTLTGDKFCFLKIWVPKNT